MGAARIRRLTLTNFRSYRAAQIEAGAGPVVLVGPNGAGKTNLIEAISFLTPGRGLRRATLEDVAFAEGDGSSAASADVEGALGLASLGTGIEPPASEDAVIPRKCRTHRQPVPAAEIALDGWMERLVPVSPAVEVEDRYRAVLKDNRARDAAAHRTLDGPHLSDLAVTHAEKQIAAADASTGEQKALLIGLVLAHAGLLAEMSGLAPVLLLDEVVAPLDPARRSALYAELDALGAQAWMTGADAAVFAEIEGKAEVFEVLPGEVKRT